mmetsp:Transcript_4275/g.11147  ORF Transcript_4275/g.11147 Transcript_4275/m.11147 type:complete len:209 (-) Transcript_4275:2295-2921(-)
MPLRLGDRRAVQEEILPRLVPELAPRAHLQLEPEHVARRRERLDEVYRLLATQATDELVEDQQGGRRERVVPERARVRPEQHQHDDPQLVQAHEHRVAAEGPFVLAPADVEAAAAHLVDGGDEHDKHAKEDEQPGESCPVSERLLFEREPRAKVLVPHEVDVVAVDVADACEGDQHRDRLVEVDLLAERKDLHERRRAQPRGEVAQHR